VASQAAMLLSRFTIRFQSWIESGEGADDSAKG
jgi:hypothetical protein